MNGVTATIADDDIDQQLKEAKLKDANNKISLHSIKKRNIEADTKIKEYHAKHIGTVGSRPTPQAKRAMESHVRGYDSGIDEVQRKYNYKYLENESEPHKTLCKICETLFESTEKHIAVDDVVWHIEEIHNQRAETVVRRN